VGGQARQEPEDFRRLYRAGNYPVEGLFYNLRPFSYDPHVWVTAAGLAEEDGLALVGFNERDPAIRAENRDGDAGKARAGADVGKGDWSGRKMRREKQRLAVVARHGIFHAADGREIQDLVPAGEQLVMAVKLRDLDAIEEANVEEIPSQERRELSLRREFRLGVQGDQSVRFKYTCSTAGTGVRASNQARSTLKSSSAPA